MRREAPRKIRLLGLPVPVSSAAHFTGPSEQGTRKQKPRLFFETEKQRFLFVFVEAAEGKQEGLWEGSGHSGQGAVGGHAGTRHE